MSVHEPDGAPRLHVIYRSHGGENLKARPSYYSKLLALTSFVRALQAVGSVAEAIFLNDGPIPDDRAELMRTVGEVIGVDCGSNRRSYRAALNLAARRPWGADDVVWFAEDDYLYAPNALQVLAAGAAAVTAADYFSLYSPVDTAAGRSRGAGARLPWPVGHGSDPLVVDGTRWFRAMSTTSTFGVRAGVLREDRRLLRVSPYSGGAWDHTSCLAVQGQRPFSWADLRVDLLPGFGRPASTWPRSITRGVVRVAMNQRSRRRPERCRTLYAADPLPIWHLETTPDEPPQAAADWATMAGQTRTWASARRIELPKDRSLPTDANAG